MFRKMMAVSAVIMVSMGFGQVAMAAEDSAQNGTIVVYRADEGIKSGRLTMDVHVDEYSLGRLKSDQAVVITRPAGQYSLGTSMKGTQPLLIDLKAGQTHYVYTDVKVRGSRVKVSMDQVEEQVAKVQQPSLDRAI